MKESKLAKKRRLMFITHMDYNYLSFNLIVILYRLDCTFSEKSTSFFKDHRKIGYIIELCEHPFLIQKLGQQPSFIAPDLKRALQNMFSRGLQKEELLYRLCNTLESQNWIRSEKSNQTNDFVNISVNREKAKNFVELGSFDELTTHLQEVRLLYSRIKSSGLETTLSNTFGKMGIGTWRSF